MSQYYSSRTAPLLRRYPNIAPELLDLILSLSVEATIVHLVTNDPGSCWVCIIEASSGKPHSTQHLINHLYDRSYSYSLLKAAWDWNRGAGTLTFDDALKGAVSLVSMSTDMRQRLADYLFERIAAPQSQITSIPWKKEEVIDVTKP